MERLGLILIGLALLALAAFVGISFVIERDTVPRPTPTLEGGAAY